MANKNNSKLYNQISKIYIDLKEWSKTNSSIVKSFINEKKIFEDKQIKYNYCIEILTLKLLLYRYVSEYLKKYFNETESKAGNKDFDYATLSDEVAQKYFAKEAHETKGFFILPSQLFENNIKRLKETKEEIVIHLGDIFQNANELALSYEKMPLDIVIRDKNRFKLPIFEQLASLEIDIKDFSRASEFLIELMYIDIVNKENYSNKNSLILPELGKLLAKITTFNNSNIGAIYDPNCGFGFSLAPFSQYPINEITADTKTEENCVLNKIHLIMKGITLKKIQIRKNNPLAKPINLDKKFDAIVSKIPHSLKWDNNNYEYDERFSKISVRIPKEFSDYAYILHSFCQLSDTGKAALICYNGALNRSGLEGNVRKYLLENNFVESVIQLPQGLFYKTEGDFSILVLSKSKIRGDILFINAKREFEIAERAKILSDENVNNIMKFFTLQENIEGISRYVKTSEIIENNYSFLVEKYILDKKLDKETMISNLNFSQNRIIISLIEKGLIKAYSKNDIDKIKALQLIYGTKGGKNRFDLYYKDKDLYILKGKDYDIDTLEKMLTNYFVKIF